MGIFEGFSLFPTFFISILVIGILRRAFSSHVANRKYKLPPRVPGLPIVGNTFQLPPIQQGLWGKEMSEKYGEM